MKKRKLVWAFVSVVVLAGIVQAASIDMCDGQYVNWKGSDGRVGPDFEWYKYSGVYEFVSDGMHLTDLSTDSRSYCRGYALNGAYGTSSYVTQYDFKFNDIDAGSNATNELAYTDGYVKSDPTADVFHNVVYASGTDYPTVGNVADTGTPNVQLTSGVWYRMVWDRHYDKTYLTIQDLSTEAIICEDIEITVQNPDRVTHYTEFSVGWSYYARDAQGDFYVNNLKIGQAIPEPATVSLLAAGCLLGLRRKK